jgi:NADPH:quinone reductase-like Zn-dependent oxidoreductase
VIWRAYRQAAKRAGLGLEIHPHTNISFEDAAAVTVAPITALQGLRDPERIQPGQKVLVDGASGDVGRFAVQIAKWFGAEVIAVCSPRNANTARSIGADHVIDYTLEDFTRSGQRYDLILGANAHHSIFDYKRALSPAGILSWVWPSRQEYTGRESVLRFSKLDSRLVDASVYASPVPMWHPAQDSMSRWFATPFLVGLFHLRLHARLSRLLHSLTVTVRFVVRDRASCVGKQLLQVFVG